MIFATVVIVAVLVLVAALLALRWHFEHQQWLQTHRNTERDMTVAKFAGRLDELEQRANSWKR